MWKVLTPWKVLSTWFFFGLVIPFGLTLRHVGSWRPNKGLNLSPLQWMCGVLTKKKPCHHHWPETGRESMSCQGSLAASALIKPECCSCLTQVSEGSSDNSWVFDLIRRSPLFAGIPLVTLLYLQECCQCAQLASFILKVIRFSAILYQCDIGSEDWHWFSIQESSTLHIKVAISCLYSSCYFKSSYQFLESQHFFF